MSYFCFDFFYLLHLFGTQKTQTIPVNLPDCSHLKLEFVCFSRIVFRGRKFLVFLNGCRKTVSRLHPRTVYLWKALSSFPYDVTADRSVDQQNRRPILVVQRRTLRGIGFNLKRAADTRPNHYRGY